MNFKYLIINLFIVIFSFNITIGQKPFEGTVKYLHTSNWTKMMSSLDYISQSRKDKMSYMWGNRSDWKEYKLLHVKNNISKFENSEESAGPEMDRWRGRKETFFIYNDFNSMNASIAFMFLNKDYLIQDSVEMPKWKIKNDIKEIAGHICMNASYKDTLRNQDIVAWFALDIPCFAGPSKYFGLPGLILEVNIDDGATILIAESIETKEISDEIELPKKLKGKNINFEEYNKMLKDYIAEKREAEEPWFWGVGY